MLDVHAPEHPVQSLRDFFLHLFTITIGLLIALGLEAAVEWRHHVHVGDEAETNIVSELKDNQRDLADVLKSVPDEEKSLLGAMAFLQAHAQGKSYDIKGINLGMSLYSSRNASWQTAGATGAVAYMNYDHVKKFSEGVYPAGGICFATGENSRLLPSNTVVHCRRDGPHEDFSTRR